MSHTKFWANVNWIDESLSSGLASSTGPRGTCASHCNLGFLCLMVGKSLSLRPYVYSGANNPLSFRQSPATMGLFSFLRIFSKHLVIWSWQHPWVWEKSPWQFIWNPQIQKALKDRCLFINLVQIWQQTLNWTNVMLFMISAYHT